MFFDIKSKSESTLSVTLLRKTHIIYQVARAMKETMKVLSQLKGISRWGESSSMQKVIQVWFDLSFASLFACGIEFWVTLIIVANFACSVYCFLKYVPMEEEE